MSMPRMRSQRLAPRLAGSAADVARAMCGAQAQDARAGVLSIGVRARDLTVRDVGPGLVRTWAWRGTLHLLAADDVPWVLALMSTRRAPAARWRQLGLDDGVYRRAREVLAALDAPVARPELRERLAAAGVDASGQRLPHLVAAAAREGLVCLGLDDRIEPLAVGELPPREEALARLASRYLDAYGPAERDDLAAWSGLPARDVKTAWAAAGLAEAGPAGAAGPGPSAEPGDGAPVVRLLPAFDTYLLGYRSRPVPPEHAGRVRPGGGIIRPVVLVDGVVAGTWRLAGDDVVVDAFAPTLPPLDDEVAHLGRFLGRRVRLRRAA
jgi:hypothetical protein